MESIERNKFIERFYEPNLTENTFIRLLFAYMYKMGVSTVHEEELAKKLYPYYKNSRYQPLFEDINKDRYFNNQVDIDDGMFKEKYFSGCITWLSGSKNLFLDYKDFEASIYEEHLDTQIIQLLKSIAEDLAIRHKFENNKLNIYGFDPNRSYSILGASHNHHIYTSILISDGDIKTISSKTCQKNVFYPDPAGKAFARQYEENGIFRSVALENATFAIMQGFDEDILEKIDIFTKIVEEEKLRKICEIAERIHNDEESLLINEKPFVRKLTIN